MQPLEFFIAHIGKKLYRDSNGCTCPDCREILKNGLTVSDRNHAEYLYMIQGDCGMIYRDKQKDTPLDVSSKI